MASSIFTPLGKLSVLKG
uniref:Uncharacterized protein n=1 Tax=Arundo donax TaxID=35708 RepID=A0A0A9FFY0_ARUDO